MTNEYNKLPVEELKKALSEKEVAWRKFRFNVSGSKPTDVKAAHNLRKDIARILTAIHGKK